MRFKRRDKLALQESYRNCFEGPHGEEVLKHLGEICHMGESSFCPGDPNSTAFKEGQRSVFLHVCILLNKNPGQLMILVEKEKANQYEERSRLSDD